MKKIFCPIVLIALLASVVACNNNEPIKSSNKKEETTILNSEVDNSSEKVTTSEASSSADKTSSNQSSSKEQASSSNSSSSAPDYVNDQLYTDSGLKIYFKAQGARIDKITWGNKQIAKDGFTVGRCANRIANGKFSIDGTEYNVTKNSGQHSLHGGSSSWQGPFANATWTKVEQTKSTITYSIHDADGKEGYPGNMDMTVKYTLSQEGELSIEYSATTDKATLCNPTNHLFMAINGETNRNYPNIKLWVNADNYTPLNNQIPTGQIASVEGTQFDYRTEKTFDGSKNYDDNYVLNGEGYRKVATMTGTSLGLKVDVFTDRAGMQLYKDGSGSICLETQMFPDMINHPEFNDYGTTILRPGEQFYSKTSYVFSEVN